jgi:hypothetical protein
MFTYEYDELRKFDNNEQEMGVSPLSYVILGCGKDVE